MAGGTQISVSFSQALCHGSSDHRLPSAPRAARRQRGRAPATARLLRVPMPSGAALTPVPFGELAKGKSQGKG